MSPGTVLAIINNQSGEVWVNVFVTKEIASGMSKSSPSFININNKIIEVSPEYISAVPVSGSLYFIKYLINTPQAINSTYVDVEIPINNEIDAPYIPLDAVYQSNDSAYVYVSNETGGRLEIKTVRVTLGGVAGNFVKVLSGLTEESRVILDRNVLEGDVISLKK